MTKGALLLFTLLVALPAQAGLPPQATAVSPGAGEVGASVPIVITGTNLAGAVLVITGSDVVVSDVAAPNDTTITGLLNISASAVASTEARLLIVTTESGRSAIEFFVVPAGVPTVTAVLPGAGEPGDIVAVTLKGLNLTGATVSLAPGDIALQNAMVVDDETITLEVVVDPMAATNVDHTLTLSPSGATAIFRVIPTGQPFFNAARPPFGNRGAVILVRFDGVNLGSIESGTGVTLSGSNIIESNALAPDEQHAQATLDIDPTASVGYRDVTITTAAGSFTRSAGFRVNISGQLPTITDVTPTLVEHGTMTPMSVTGSNFAGGAVLVTGSGATVSNVVVDPTGTLITFDLTLTADAPAGGRGVIAVTENGIAQFNIASVGPPTVTTTTLPPCSLCDDGDPCTADVCASSQCVHHEVTGREAMTCAYERSFTCPGTLVPNGITLAWSRARDLTTVAMGSSPPKAKRLLKRSGSLLAKTIRKLGRLVQRRNNVISSGCGDLLTRLLGDALARVNTCLAERCFVPSTSTTTTTSSTTDTTSGAPTTTSTTLPDITGAWTFYGTQSSDTCGYFTASVTWGIHINWDGTGTLSGLDLDPLDLDPTRTSQDSTGWQVTTHIYDFAPVPGCGFFAQVQNFWSSGGYGDIWVVCNNGSYCYTNYTGYVSR